MRVQKIKKGKKNILIVVGTIILILVCAAVLYLWYSNVQSPPQEDKDDSPTQSIDYNTPTDEQIEDGQNTKDRVIEEDKNQGLEESLKVSIHATQNDSQVIIDTLVQDVLDSGTCTLTVTSGSQQVTKTADIFANPSSSSCQGFSLKKSELPAGSWSLKLAVSASGLYGSTSITIGVR